MKRQVPGGLGQFALPARILWASATTFALSIEGAVAICAES